MHFDFISGLFVLMLSTFLGLDVIRRVSRLLHTPLMSLTNAISAIAIVGAVLLAGEQKTTLSTVLGAIAVFASMTNIVSGFLITDRMLKMFKKREPGQVMEQLIQALYLLSAIGFIFSLRWMNDPKTARQGVAAGVGRDGARRRRHHAPPRDQELRVDPRGDGARHDGRRAAVARRADRGAATDGALARVRRPRRRPRRHRQVLPLGRHRPR